MNRPIAVSASILAANLGNLERDIKRCEEAGVDRLHIDCMDGHFVPQLTIGPMIIEAVRRFTKLYLEAHLMIEHPGEYIENYAEAGADCIQLQLECYGTRRASCRRWDQWPKEIDEVDVPTLRADLKKIRKLGKKAFVVVNPKTALCEEVLNDCDGVLIMSVNPGFSGQKFMPEVLPKIERLKTIFKGDIAIDGGINAQSAPLTVTAGAHVLISGSYLFSSPNFVDTVRHLKSLA
ncbi:MAG: ribulose-phosphate 3-epimerase [Candidatus Omnitrophica bacterium]|nr:ribulose-phosphate 3-epimerase [Candidatus Omnitrophota bacterium]